MMNMKNSVAFTFLLLASFVSAQKDPSADEYIRLADDYKKNARPDSAVIYYEKASLEFKTLGSMEKFINAYNQIAIILTRQDKYEKALAYLETALATGRSLSDTSNLEIANTYISLGVVYNAEEKYDQSLVYHNRSLAIRLLKLGENDAQVATNYGNIGNVYFNAKNYERSIDAHLKTMKIRESVFGKTSPEIIESYNGLGKACRERKDYKASLDFFEKALQNKIIQRGQGHKDLSKFYKNISEVYFLMDNKGQGNIYKVKAEEVLK
jgi:tetratricopeptide (TPR) repeat protein